MAAKPDPPRPACQSGRGPAPPDVTGDSGPAGVPRPRGGRREEAGCRRRGHRRRLHRRGWCATSRCGRSAPCRSIVPIWPGHHLPGSTDRRPADATPSVTRLGDRVRPGERDPDPDPGLGDRDHRRLLRHLPGDDPGFADKFLAGAAATGVPAREIPVAEALRAEPRLNPGILRAIEVQDGSVDGWQLVWGAANSAKAYGAQILTYHKVTKITRDGNRVAAVHCLDLKNGEEVQIDCSFVLNCAGPWAGQIAAMADCEPVDVIPGRGIMIAMNHRLVNRVVNRAPPRRRRHPGAGAHGEHHRHHRREGRRPRRPGHRTRRGAADAGRRRGADPGLPPSRGPCTPGRARVR